MSWSNRLCRTEVETKAAMLNAAANALNAIHLMCPVTRVQSSECRLLDSCRTSKLEELSHVVRSLHWPPVCQKAITVGFWRPERFMDRFYFWSSAPFWTIIICSSLFLQPFVFYTKHYALPCCWRMLHKETSRLLEYSENVDGANYTELQSWFKCQPRHPLHSGFSCTHSWLLNSYLVWLFVVSLNPFPGFLNRYIMTTV